MSAAAPSPDTTAPAAGAVAGAVAAGAAVALTALDQPPAPPRYYEHVEEYSDTGNADRLAHRYTGRLRYVTAWGWLAYDEQRGVWTREDGTLLAHRAAKDTLRAWLHEAADRDGIRDRDRDAAPDDRKRLLNHINKSYDRIRQMVDTAQSCPELTGKVGDFDSNPWLLGVQNGVLDLHTGQFTPGHHPGYRLTRQAHVVYDPAATAPTWERFLGEVFRHDGDLIAYVQRALGYSLTADNREDAFFVCYGSGGNGKSTLLNAMSALLGDYAAPLRSEALMTQPHGTNSGAASPELAALVGRRLVTAQEPQHGKLAEDRVKELTGRDPLQVRELHRAPFTLQPTFKLWLSTNDRPEVTDVSEGLWRRIRQIPFLACFKDHPDRDLDAKLHAEASGILNWLLAGEQMWRREGLGTCRAVEQATHDYRAQSDPYLDFFTEWLVPDRQTLGAMVKLSAAHEAFQRWRREHVQAGLGHVDDLRLRAFGTQAEMHGYGKAPGPRKQQYLYDCRLTTQEERAAREQREAEAEAGDGGDGADGEGEAKVRHSRCSDPLSPIISPIAPCEEIIGETPPNAANTAFPTPTATGAPAVPATDEDEDEDDQTEWERRKRCRHQGAYEQAGDGLWVCAVCERPIACGHPADHQTRYWQANGGCAACLTAGLTRLRERQAAASAVPALPREARGESAWARAFSLLPTCPNPYHDHTKGTVCRISKLPLPQPEKWAKAAECPFEAFRDAEGKVVDIKPPLAGCTGLLPAAGAYLLLDQHLDLPADHKLRRVYEQTAARFEAEVKKLTCPHPAERIQTRTYPGSRRVFRRCLDCGADLSDPARPL